MKWIRIFLSGFITIILSPTITTSTEFGIGTTSTTSIVSTTTTPTTTPITSTTAISNNDCTRCGDLYADPNDCTSYFVCVNDSCGNLIKARIFCDSFSTFDPINKVCTFAYNYYCPNSVNLRPECTYQYQMIADPGDPTRYYICVPQGVLELIQRRKRCPLGLIFNQTSLLCSCNESLSYDGCPPDVEDDEPPDDCLKLDSLPEQPFYEDTVCTKQGIFADALNCNMFIVCLETECGVFTKYKSTCNGLNNFDPVEKKCLPYESVQCLCSNRNTTFTCVDDGLFVDPTCPSQYYLCVHILNIKFYGKNLTCLPGLIFNPKTSSCTAAIEQDISDCSSSSSSSSESSDHSSSLYSSDASSSDKSKSSFESESYSGSSSSENEICKYVVGPIPCDKDNKSYFICINNILTKKSCHKYEIFDKQTGKCCQEKSECENGKDCNNKHNKNVENNVLINIVNNL